MNPLVIALISAVTVALPLAVFLAPMIGKELRSRINEKDRARLFAAVRGAAIIVGGVAKKTPISIDDGLAQVLELVANELGRPLTPDEERHAAHLAVTLHADSDIPGIRLGTGDPVAALAAVKR